VKNLTEVWRNKKISSDGNNQSEFRTSNSNSNSKAESELDNDNDSRNVINMDVENVTDLRIEERLEKQDGLSNVKTFNQHKHHNKRYK
jgi:hypothetical protein